MHPVPESKTHPLEHLHEVVLPLKVPIGDTASLLGVRNEVEDFLPPGPNGLCPHSPFKVLGMLSIDAPPAQGFLRLSPFLHPRNASKVLFEEVEFKERWVLPGNVLKNLPLPWSEVFPSLEEGETGNGFPPLSSQSSGLHQDAGWHPE